MSSIPNENGTEYKTWFIVWNIWSGLSIAIHWFNYSQISEFFGLDSGILRSSPNSMCSIPNKNGTEYITWFIVWNNWIGLNSGLIIFR